MSCSVHCRQTYLIKEHRSIYVYIDVHCDTDVCWFLVHLTDVNIGFSDKRLLLVPYIELLKRKTCLMHTWTWMTVVIRRRLEKQTKESARRDGAAVAWLLCGHMSLLCWAKP